MQAVASPEGKCALRVQMRRSTVIGEAGSSIQDNIRTSYGTFLLRRHDSTVARMEDRLAAWTQLPMIHQEDLQVCHAAPFAMPMTGRSLSIIDMLLHRISLVSADTRWMQLSLTRQQYRQACSRHVKAVFAGPKVLSSATAACLILLC